jgi:hypothetical protein
MITYFFYHSWFWLDPTQLKSFKIRSFFDPENLHSVRNLKHFYANSDHGSRQFRCSSVQKYMDFQGIILPMLWYKTQYIQVWKEVCVLVH